MPSEWVKQPNSHNCFVCGLRNPVGLKLQFFETGPDEVTAVFHPTPDYEGFPGVLHGGIIAALLDEVGQRTGLIGEPDHFRVTAKLEVKFRLPTPLDQPLTLVGQRLKNRGRLQTAHAEARLPDGTITAEAEITLADPPPGVVPEGVLETLGWKVYD